MQSAIPDSALIKRFGEIYAVDGISFGLRIGSNGAGKPRRREC